MLLFIWLKAIDYQDFNLNPTKVTVFEENELFLLKVISNIDSKKTKFKQDFPWNEKG